MPNRKLLDRTCAVLTVVLGLALTGTLLYSAAWLAQYEFSHVQSSLGTRTAPPEFWDIPAVAEGLTLWSFTALPLIILCVISVIISVICLAFASWILTPFCTAVANGLEISRNRRAHHSAIRIRRQLRLRRARA